MDRTVNVRLFSVERRDNAGKPFGKTIEDIAARRLAKREKELEPDIWLRLESAERKAGNIVGEIMRIQSGNLPPRALRGQPKAPLGVQSIGHSSIFVYDPKLGAVALQMARNGITPVRLALYAEALGGSGYDILPIINTETWNKLKRGHVRGLSIRLATPSELESADEDTRTIKSGMRSLKDAVGTQRITATFSVTRGDPDIERPKATRILRWFSREREAGRGDISKITATVAADEAQAEILNLISAQLGNSTTLDLPDDNPDLSYDLRVEFAERVLRANRQDIEAQFGG